MDQLKICTEALASQVHVRVIVFAEVMATLDCKVGAIGFAVSTITLTDCEELAQTFQTESVSLACILFTQTITGTEDTLNNQLEFTLQLDMTIQEPFKISTCVFASQVQDMVTVEPEVVRLVEVIVGAAGAVVSRVIDEFMRLVFQAKSLSNSITHLSQSQALSVIAADQVETMFQVADHVIQGQLIEYDQVSFVEKLTRADVRPVIDHDAKLIVQVGGVESKVMVKLADQTEEFNAASEAVTYNVLSHSVIGTQAIENTHDGSAAQTAITLVHFFTAIVELASQVQLKVIVGVLTRVQEISVIIG